MPITVECDGCSKTYRVSDDKAGSVIRCKDCGEKIRIPADDESEERPVRRKSGGTGRKKGKAKSNSSLGLILGLVGGGVMLLFVFVGVLIWMLAGRGNQPAPVANQGNPPGAGVGVPAVTPNGTPPAANPGTTPAASTSWNVAADPPKNPVTWPASPPKLDGFRGQLSQLKFTSTRTPFVISGTVGSGDYMRVWNLATGEIVGQFDRPKPQINGTKSALSFDGARIGLVPSGKKEVEIWSVREGQLEKTLSLGEKLSSIDYIDFLPTNQLLVVEKDRSPGRPENHLAILDLATGNRVHEIVLPENIHADKVALSPGYRFLVLDHGYKEGLGFYDLTRAAAVGRIPPGEYTDSGSGSSGLQFSPDGSKLGILGTSGGQTSVVVVDLATGKAKKAASVQGMISSLSYSNAPQLQWLDDGQGWLAGGNVILDPVSGKAVWKVQTEVNQYGLENSRARLPVGNSLWSVDGPDNDGVVTQIEIPWTTIRERLNALDDASNLLKAGAGVSVAAEVGAVRFAEAESVKQELIQGLAGRLTALGLKPGDGQPLVMRAVYSEAPGNTLEFGGLGVGAGPKKSVQATKSTLELKLTDAAGQTVYWIHKSDNNPLSMFMKGDPSPETVRKNSFDGVLLNLRGLSLPYYLTTDPTVQLPVLHPMPRW